ncbi:MAG: hypothetical protein ACLR02_08260 [Clostridium sp.]|jgi:rRNA maturation endonuclease Nob1
MEEPKKIEYSFWLKECTSCGYSTYSTRYNTVCTKCGGVAICGKPSRKKSK